ncbi:MAG: glycerophosphoryl diester phosphodiesterase membrane domain-containing protein [Xenococcaceae cyanobacterium MO_188.B32]|nr:glycerophosphoryl diester phosphodiesterase membrane domain-containing protein [Xenococcaceae cyanobacterium MO_188.B32]
MKSLTVGNVVSVGLRIYRDHFTDYFRLAFIGYLWILVPIYGWAKLAATMGLISRLAFGEITENSESIRDAQRYIKPRIWKFLSAGILVALIFIGAWIAVLLGIFIFSLIAGLIITFLSNIAVENTMLLIIISIVAGLITVIGFILIAIGIIWLFSRLFIVELPLGIEENINATEAISRSWELTKDSVFRIQLIVFIAFLISLPITAVIQIASLILQGILGSIYPTDSGIFAFLYAMAIFAISLGSYALMSPFWQCIKAVIYYDLRVRREGFGMEIRDKN